MEPFSLYLHIPFCLHRCGYCDFNTYAGLGDLIPAYVNALCAEIKSVALAAGKPLPVHTVFFGGGTPSLLNSEQLERILGVIEQGYKLLPETEITLEANPGTLSYEYLVSLRSLGINRLSLGVQSANPAELLLLERQHDYLDVIQSVAWARRAGFDNLNLDIIFGLPSQSLPDWQRTLELVLGLHPEHFSLYALSLEHGTPLEHWAQRGLISEPDPDLAAEMYEWATGQLEQAGYRQYEISNWAVQRGEQALVCRHNLQYWRSLPYLGLGAGAHGYANKQRTVNVLAPAAYIRRLVTTADATVSLGFPQTPATQSMTAVEPQAEIGEFMMMGLRLVDEGVSDQRFRERFGTSLRQVFDQQIERLVQLGLLEWADPEGAILRLSERGRLLGNQVFVEFI